MGNQVRVESLEIPVEPLIHQRYILLFLNYPTAIGLHQLRVLLLHRVPKGHKRTGRLGRQILVCCIHLLHHLHPISNLLVGLGKLIVLIMIRASVSLGESGVSIILAAGLLKFGIAATPRLCATMASAPLDSSMTRTIEPG